MTDDVLRREVAGRLSAVRCGQASSRVLLYTEDTDAPEIREARHEDAFMRAAAAQGVAERTCLYCPHCGDCLTCGGACYCDTHEGGNDQ